MHAFDTARLHLRPLGAADEALYCRLYTDPGVMRHIAAPMTALAAHRSFHAACKQQAPQRQRWILSERATGASIGLLGLFVDGEAAEIGLMLVTPAQGRGYAGEGLAAMIDRSFASMLLGLLWTRHASDNGAIRSVLRKLGFVGADPMDTQPAQLRWHMTRAVWLARRETAVAPPRPAGTGQLSAFAP